MRSRVLTAVPVLVVASVLGGCAQATETVPQAASAAPTTGPSPDADTTGTQPITHPSEGQGDPTDAPSLPPGDPGIDAPAVPDPGAATGEDGHGHDEPRRRVPDAAMLTTYDLEQTVGGSWRALTGQREPCTPMRDAVARRSAGYVDGDTGVLRQQVTTHTDIAAADRAVLALRDELASCGWTILRDPRLGSASVAARRDGELLTAVSADGVGMVLSASGAAVSPRWRWDTVVDLALGSSCPAAPDGCH